MAKNTQKHLAAVIYAALAVITFIVYRQVPHNDFVLYDDNAYVTNNPAISNGLTLESVLWAFKAPRVGFWHPLTIISHMLDCELFGQKPFWHHLVSLLFHIANTLLLFLILKNMTAALWQSAFVAAAFALHPLHVESVAWVAQRKDVLSTLFWLLTMAAYVHYIRRPDAARYLLTLLLFALGLMAKPMLVTLPFVLLLLDYWPLQRMTLDVPAVDRRRLITNLICEKLPFFVLAAVFSLIAFYAERGFDAFSLKLPFSVRLGNAFVSYAAYIGKMIWPARLAVLYPHQGLNLPLWQVFAGFLTIAVLSIWIFRLGRRYKYLPVGWLWYLGTLVPVIGLFQIGIHAMADRYTYVPLIGLFIIIAWGSADLLAGRSYRKIILSLSASAVLSALAICTFFQTCYWRNGITLFEQAIKVTGGNFLMHSNLGSVLASQGRLDEAIDHFRKAVRLKPDSPDVFYNLGRALYSQGKLDEAIHCLRQAILLKPDAETYYCLGYALQIQGSFDQAVDNYRQAVRLKPDYVEAYISLAALLMKTGQFENAVKAEEKALELTDGKNKELADQIRKQLLLYKQSKQ